MTKEQILAEISHELLTPLAATHQSATILKEELAGKLNAQQKECLATIFRNVKQLETVIGDVLEVSPDHSGKLTIEDKPILQMEEIISDLLRALRSSAAEKVVSMSICGCDAPPAHVSHARVRQIISGLLNRALKVTPAICKNTTRARIHAHAGERIELWLNIS